MQIPLQITHAISTDKKALYSFLSDVSSEIRLAGLTPSQIFIKSVNPVFSNHTVGAEGDVLLYNKTWNNKLLSRLNASLKVWASRIGFTYLDEWDLLLENIEHKYVDSIHPNVEGTRAKLDCGLWALCATLVHNKHESRSDVPKKTA